MESDEGQPLASRARVEGARLFWSQTWALLQKNALLAWRSKAATFLQLFSSFFFLFIVWAVNQAVSAALRSTTQFSNVPNPEAMPIGGIPSCQDALFLEDSCYDFLWAGNTSATVRSIVAGMCSNNPGRPINAKTETLGFNTSADVDAWLLDNPYRSSVAVVFQPLERGRIGYGLQVNSTPKSFRGKYEDITYKFLLPLQASVERELSRYYSKNPELAWTPSVSEFAHPASDVLNTVAQSAAIFLFAAAMFNFVIQMSNLVIEKETRLRQAMATMGLMDSVYWLTWTVWELMLAVISCLLLMGFGHMFQFEIFKGNGFGAVYLLFFLFWASMTSFAFFMSTFLKKSTSANTIGFFMFIIGFILQIVVIFGFPYSDEFTVIWRILFNLFPPNLLALGLKYFGQATALPGGTGISMANASQCPPRDPNCVMTMAGIFIWLVVLSLAYLLLALYLDNVFPDVNGVRKSPFFCLTPSFWTGREALRDRGAPGNATEGQEIVDGDVLEEEQRVRGALKAQGSREEDKTEAEGEGDTPVALSVQGLGKTFPGRRTCCGKLVPPFQAVKGPWFEVEKESLFCLLGPNGAGKSTTINCLTGIIPSSYGEGLIYGGSVRSAASMGTIRRSIGVCPQFDVLWDRLTGREHLRLFARIKGLPPSLIGKEVEALLGEVRLEESGGLRTSSYSGGMKRRLSVAVALIGDPSIVFLDEPTTGMDPVSRRYVWDIIERAKRGRAIVLTTHSMEEADILGDRIAIMAKGRLRCIGTSIRLKDKFGSGLVVTVGLVGGAGGTGGAGERGGAGHELLSGAGDAGADASSGEGGEKESLLESQGEHANGEGLANGHHMNGRHANGGHLNGGRADGTGAQESGDGGSGELEASREAVRGLFLERLGVECARENGSYLQFNIPQEQGQEGAHTEGGSELTAFFRELKARKQKLGISDVQLSLTTLEEVFLNIARTAELETAAKEGRFDTVILPSGVIVKVPVGAERVRLPSLGSQESEGQGPWEMEVEWQQDESGNLRILRSSDPAPVGRSRRQGARRSLSRKKSSSGGSTDKGKKGQGKKKKKGKQGKQGKKAKRGVKTERGFWPWGRKQVTVVAEAVEVGESGEQEEVAAASRRNQRHQGLVPGHQAPGPDGQVEPHSEGEEPGGNAERHSEIEEAANGHSNGSESHKDMV